MDTAIITTTVTTMPTSSALLRLLQLSSASLPVGAYAFSQGLEYAVEEGWVDSVVSAKEWLQLQATEGLAYVDLPLLVQALDTLERDDIDGLMACNDWLLACRETRELRLTDTATGEALMRLLKQLDVPLPDALDKRDGDISFVVAFALAAQHWQIDTDAALTGYAWSWLENQVAAATKLVPLGQTQAQQLIGELQQCIPQCIDIAKQVESDEIGSGLPALAIASAQHETQYTRLFRS